LQELVVFYLGSAITSSIREAENEKRMKMIKEAYEIAEQEFKDNKLPLVPHEQPQEQKQ